MGQVRGARGQNLIVLHISERYDFQQAVFVFFEDLASGDLSCLDVALERSFADQFCRAVDHLDGLVNTVRQVRLHKRCKPTNLNQAEQVEQGQMAQAAAFYLSFFVLTCAGYGQKELVFFAPSSHHRRCCNDCTTTTSRYLVFI